jgi:hypothetical protein
MQLRSIYRELPLVAQKSCTALACLEKHRNAATAKTFLRLTAQFHIRMETDDETKLPIGAP